MSYFLKLIQKALYEYWQSVGFGKIYYAINGQIVYLDVVLATYDVRDRNGNFLLYQSLVDCRFINKTSDTPPTVAVISDTRVSLAELAEIAEKFIFEKEMKK